MRALVLGGGGREHALARGLADSPSVDEVLCGPGNPGTAAFAENVAVTAGALKETIVTGGDSTLMLEPEALAG